MAAAACEQCDKHVESCGNISLFFQEWRGCVLTLFCYPWFILSTLGENKVLKLTFMTLFFQECLSCNLKSIRKHKSR